MPDFMFLKAVVDVSIDQLESATDLYIENCMTYRKLSKFYDHNDVAASWNPEIFLNFRVDGIERRWMMWDVMIGLCEVSSVIFIDSYTYTYEQSGYRYTVSGDLYLKTRVGITEAMEQCIVMSWHEITIESIDGGELVGYSYNEKHDVATLIEGMLHGLVLP